MDWVNAVVQGVLLGGLYALLATGLSLTFGVMRLVNLAHGDLAILAAFCRPLVLDARLDPVLAILVSCCRWCSASAILLQKVIFDRLVGVDPAFQIVATFGLASSSRTSCWRATRLTVADSTSAR